METLKYLVVGEEEHLHVIIDKPLMQRTADAPVVEEIADASVSNLYSVEYLCQTLMLLSAVRDDIASISPCMIVEECLCQKVEVLVKQRLWERMKGYGTVSRC